MKYVFGIILGLFLFSCQTQEPVQFKNPIFYETLYPISKTVRETRLTPTKIYVNAFISEKECRLLKNTETVLEFSCEYDHPFSGHFSDVFYRYVIEGEESKYTNCLIVRLEMPGGTAWFCIHREKPQD